MAAGYTQMGHWVERLPGGGGVAFSQYARAAAPEAVPAATAVAANSHISPAAAPGSPCVLPDLQKQAGDAPGMLSAVASVISMADFGSASIGSLHSDDMDMSDAHSDASERTNLGGSWLLLDSASPAASPTASGCSSPSCNIPRPPPELCAPSVQQDVTPPSHPSQAEVVTSLDFIAPAPTAPDAFAKVLKKFSSEAVPSGSAAAIDAFMADKIAAGGLEDPVWVVDLGAVQRLYQAWVEAMPRVRPFYAAKCNMDPGLLAALSSLGAGFDCASEVSCSASGHVIGTAAEIA